MKTFALCSFGAMAALALASGGCELIAAVDHDLIPQGGGLPIGGGGGGTTTATTTGMGGMGGSGGSGMCDLATCPEPPSDCQEKACNGAVCGDPTNIAMGTACNTAEGEGGGGGGTDAGFCDDAGTCVECLEDMHCTAPEVCDETANTCVPAQCQNGSMDGDETGLDCGGPTCGDCPNGQGCDGPGDCLSAFCNGSMMCAACTGTGAGECLGTEYCDAGICVAKKADGQSCAGGHECTNTFCATTGQGGICCNEGCAGDCRSCAMADTGTANGTCADVTAGSDPKNACTNDAAGCEANDCAGGGVCESATGENCGSGPTCMGDDLSPQDTCDASGVCQSGTAMACAGGFACDATPDPDVCLSGTCNAHPQCASTHFCGGVGGAGGTAMMCNQKLAGGQVCAVDAECANGDCLATLFCN